MMERISSFEEIQSLFKETRDLKRGFVTNFYPDAFRVSLWCQHESLFFMRHEDTVFFLRDRQQFVNLFYCSTCEESLKRALPVFLKECGRSGFVVDLVGNETIAFCERLFYAEGFEEHSVLVRMSRVGTPETMENESGSVVSEAVEEDIPPLLALYDRYFDPRVEQIPLKEELKQWMEAKHILVHRVDGTITGFLIYDLVGMTLYLRYWFVHPDYREYKIGSALFHEFFYQGRHTKRQLFWVIASNENAIKRYVHYGFSREKMFDYVLIKK